MREGRGHVEYGAPGRGQKTPGKRRRDQDRPRASERQRKGPTSQDPMEPSVLSSLTRRSHPSPSSGHHCPRPGAGVGEAGGGHRSRGLSVPRALPPRSQPGLQCCPRCLGSGAAHRTGGRQEGESPQETSLPWHPGDAPPCTPDPALSFPVSEPCHLRPRTSHGAIWVGLRALPHGLLLYPGPVKNVPPEREGPEERD